MSVIELFAIAVALALDAFAVAVCAGCTLPKVTAGHFIRMSGTFGFFQFAMPVIGWFLGRTVHEYISAWDHWIAFALLAWIGGNMLRSGLSGGCEEEESGPDPSSGRQLFMLAVATSLDALAVGLSFSLLGLSVWGPALLIGVVCAVITALGLLAGRMLSEASLFGKRAELLGGVVLIGIGLKILHEHGVFAFFS